MANVPLEVIDVTTPYPNGEYGEPIKEAFEKVNRNFAKVDAVTGDIPGLIAEVEAVRDEVVQLGNEIPNMVDTAINGRIPGKNRIINGDFRIWQRGTNFPAATGQRYTADRWQGNGTGSTLWVQRVDVPPGGGTVPILKDAKYMLQAIVSSVAGAGNFALVQQRIEGLRPLSGKTLCVSFKAKASADNFKIGVEFQQSFGPGGSPGVDTLGGSVTLGVDWKQYTVVIPVPSVVGKTMTDGDYLQLSFWLDAGANFAARSFGAGQKSGTVSITEVQVEDGGVATGFEQRPDATELVLCQRYYEKSYNVSEQPAAANAVGYESAIVASGGFFLSSAPRFRVTKRASPGVTVYRYDNGSPGEWVEYSTTGSPVAGRAASITGIGTQGFELRGTGAAAGGNIARYHWAADAEL